MRSGVLPLLGERHRFELRSEPYRERPLSTAHGDLIRWFEVIGEPLRLGEGHFALIHKPVVSLGPRGRLGHLRIATWERETLWEGEVFAAADNEEAASSKAALVLRLPSLELAQDQPVQIDRFEWGKP